MNTIYYLNKLVDKQDLTGDEIRSLFAAVSKGELDPIQIAAVLIALRMKGETVEEIGSLIQEMRSHIVDFPAYPDAIDTCGTGGDGTGTFNISTTVAFVAAGAGIQIIKHGNKAASSKCGSADVLSELGVNIMLTPEQANNVFKKVGMVFLYASLYHPAMKYIAPVRKSLGTRTVFNFLGPFLNPAQVKRQLIGVPNAELAEKLAKVAATLQYEHAVIVSSNSGMDEMDVSGATTIYEIRGKSVLKKSVNPQTLGFKKTNSQEMHGGSMAENAQIIRDILSGKKGAKRDVVVLNSAYALYVAGKVKDIRDGMRLAELSIDSGEAKNILDNLVKETRKYEK
ncbi:MAG TPA: anthranilate phosphoribosyltransferase [Candidatus Acidoferrales bacterium]|nr:anthranilate phosphoribosyltransferase [Candidatus Acidoferrales bacterium]